jgi:hypothetical protein
MISMERVMKLKKNLVFTSHLERKKKLLFLLYKIRWFLYPATNHSCSSSSFFLCPSCPLRTNYASPRFFPSSGCRVFFLTNKKFKCPHFLKKMKISKKIKKKKRCFFCPPHWCGSSCLFFGLFLFFMSLCVSRLSLHHSSCLNVYLRAS